jgi:hypothetical protein
MEINVEQVINDLDGNKILEEDGKVFTAKTAIIRSLLAPFEDEKNLDGKEKFERGELASVLYRAEGGKVNLKAEDVALIKKLVAKLYGTYVVWQVWKMLDS